jgi:MFS-type transporter involved in bile tolerance (Atg22 family)
MMVAFTVYNDGIQTIIKMASAVRFRPERHRSRSDLITAILIVQFIGVPCAFAFGYDREVQTRREARRSLVGLARVRRASASTRTACRLDARVLHPRDR